MPTAVLLRGFLTFAFFCADAYVPLAIQGWRGEPAIVSGLVFTASTLSWTGGAWIQAHRIERIGPLRFLVTGFVVLTLGIGGFALILIPSVPLIVAVVAWSVAGLAMGLSYSTLSIVVLREAPAEEPGRSDGGPPALGRPRHVARDRARRGPDRRRAGPRRRAGAAWRPRSASRGRRARRVAPDGPVGHPAASGRHDAAVAAARGRGHEPSPVA